MSEYAGKTASIGGGKKTHRIAGAQIGGIVWIRTACGRHDKLVGEAGEQLPTCKMCLKKEPRRPQRTCACCGADVLSAGRVACSTCINERQAEVEGERHAQSIEPLPAPFEKGWWASVVHQEGPRPTRVQVDGPPCGRCRDWNPHINLSRDGSVHKLNLCTTDFVRRSNFSCFRERS
jgi:hypothetical protein